MNAIEEIEGTTLKVYVYLLEVGKPRSVREIARDLNLPTSTVHYHLRKLEELGIVGRTGDGFVIRRTIPVEGFILIGRKLMPRLFVYAMFYLGATIGVAYIVFTQGLTPDNTITLLVSSTASGILFIEGFNLLKRLKSS